MHRTYHVNRKGDIGWQQILGLVLALLLLLLLIWIAVRSGNVSVDLIGGLR